MLKHLPVQILSESKFLMRQDLFDSFAYSILNKDSFFFDDAPSYEEVRAEVCAMLNSKDYGDVDIYLTTEFESLDINDNSIAYYMVDGTIISDDYWWWFSTKRFVDQLKAADRNPQINAHFIHIKSGGGEAWYLDKVYETMTALQKPTYVIIEKYGCSAAYYIAAPANKIVAVTKNDIIGSIGTMATTWNYDGWWEMNGVKRVTAYATKSDLKNKKHEDFRKGNGKQFIKDELDPLQEQFEAAVRNSRSAIAALPVDDPVVRGETYDSPNSKEIGLIDDIVPTFEDAILECHNMGMEWKSKQNTFKRASLFI